MVFQWIANPSYLLGSPRSSRGDSAVSYKEPFRGDTI